MMVLGEKSVVLENMGSISDTSIHLAKYINKYQTDFFVLSLFIFFPRNVHMLS